LPEIHENQEEQNEMSEVNVFLRCSKFLLHFEAWYHGCHLDLQIKYFWKLHIVKKINNEKIGK